MERKILIPDNPHILLEIKRLINAVVGDNTESFDIFENDVFIFYDPEDVSDEDLMEDEEKSDSASHMTEVDPPDQPSGEKTDLQEQIEQGIAEGDPDEDDDFIGDDDCCDGEEPEENPFGIFMAFDPGMLKKGSGSPPMQSTYDLFDDEDEEDEPNDANFVYKPTNLKFWWRLGDGHLYTNQFVKYRQLFRIIDHCIASMGRRTAPFLVRYNYYGADGDEKR